MFLVAPPARVARDSIKAVRRGGGTVYTPWFWLLIMTAIRLIPDPLFRRLKL
jgi:hypothetical protein